ncbi:hypothetical protein CRG98_002933 [Punica granatum]|uniref:Uncharacterized protein n=1 Tax=Punica granatum TaxID=22663 RepID=A0A2I0L7D8_PUNGR|nr:hypothetical protein CRG98_002933 [Punica granatum]
MGCYAWGTLNSGSPVIATLERLDYDWGPHSCTFLDCGLACTAVLGKARGARSVAIAEGGLGPFFDRQCDHAGSPVASGLGHAMFVGAVACDLLWREGRSSVFGVQGGSREVFPVTIVVVWDSGYLLVGYFLQ